MTGETGALWATQPAGLVPSVSPWPKDVRGESRAEALLLLPETVLFAVHRAACQIHARAVEQEAGLSPRVGFTQ